MTGNTEKYSENKMDDKVDAGLKRPGCIGWMSLKIKMDGCIPG